MNKFRIGDKVRCIDRKNNEIIIGNIYEVLGYTENEIQVENVFGVAITYPNELFELVITPEDLEQEDYVLIRAGSIVKVGDYKANGQHKFMNKDLTYKFNKNFDIMAIYSKEGYDLIKLWERPKEKTKEELTISLIKSAITYLDSEKAEEILTKAIQILKEQGE